MTWLHVVVPVLLALAAVAHPKIVRAFPLPSEED
jgi:hypothetical protein